MKRERFRLEVEIYPNYVKLTSLSKTNLFSWRPKFFPFRLTLVPEKIQINERFEPNSVYLEGNVHHHLYPSGKK